MRYYYILKRKLAVFHSREKENQEENHEKDIRFAAGFMHAAVLFAVPAFAEGEESTQPAEAGITDDSGLREALSSAQPGRHSDAGR